MNRPNPGSPNSSGPNVPNRNFGYNFVQTQPVAVLVAPLNAAPAPPTRVDLGTQMSQNFQIASNVPPTNLATAPAPLILDRRNYISQPQPGNPMTITVAANNGNFLTGPNINPMVPVPTSSDIIRALIEIYADPTIDLPLIPNLPLIPIEGFCDSDGLDSLYRTKHAFIQPKLPNADLELEDVYPSSSTLKKFNIVSTDGDRIFIGIQSKQKQSCWCCGIKLNLAILGNDGSEVFKITSNSGGFMVQTCSGKISCFIEERSRRCSPDLYFRILDPSRNLCYKIIHDRSTKNSYDYAILAQDGIRIGKIGKTWIGLPRRDQTLAHSYGVSFPANTPVVDKTSLLIVGIILYFKLVDNRNLEQRRGEFSCMFLILYFLLLMVIVLGVALFSAYSYRVWFK